MNGAAKIMKGCRLPQRLVQIRSLITPTQRGIRAEKMPSPPMAKPIKVADCVYRSRISGR